MLLHTELTGEHEVYTSNIFFVVYTSVSKHNTDIIFDFIIHQGTTNLMYDKVLKLYS
jgi:hypothetical protein